MCSVRVTKMVPGLQHAKSVRLARPLSCKGACSSSLSSRCRFASPCNSHLLLPQIAALRRRKEASTKARSAPPPAFSRPLGRRSPFCNSHQHVAAERAIDRCGGGRGPTAVQDLAANHTKARHRTAAPAAARHCATGVLTAVSPGHDQDGIVAAARAAAAAVTTARGAATQAAATAAESVVSRAAIRPAAAAAAAPASAAAAAAAAAACGATAAEDEAAAATAAAAAA